MADLSEVAPVLAMDSLELPSREWDQVYVASITTGVGWSQP